MDMNTPYAIHPYPGTLLRSRNNWVLRNEPKVQAQFCGIITVDAVCFVLATHTHDTFVGVTWMFLLCENNIGWRLFEQGLFELVC